MSLTNREVAVDRAGVGCFACGPDNPVGLHLHFHTAGDEYVADFTPSSHHQGFAGIVHGGILATLLDEAMGRNLWERSLPAVTAELKISLHCPAYVGQPLRAIGRIVQAKGRLILCEARIERKDGTRVASAEGKFVRVKNMEPDVAGDERR